MGKKSKLYISWIKYLLVLLLIPTVICILIYSQASSVLKQEVNKSNELFLNQMRVSFNEILSSVENSALNITTNDRVQQLASVYGSFEENNSFDIYKVSQRLEEIKLFNKFIKNIYVYYMNTGTIVGPSYHISSEEYYDLHKDSIEKEYEEWKKILSSQRARRLTTFSNDYEKSSNIYYLQSFPFSPKEAGKATLVIEIESSQLSEHINILENIHNSETFIINSEDCLIASDKTKWELLKQHDFNGQEGKYVIQNDDYVISVINSDFIDIKYISLVERKQFWLSSYYIKSIFYIGFSIIVILGLLLVFYFVRKNYKPIGNLIHTVSQSTGVSYQKEKNEYDYLENVIDFIIYDKEKTLTEAKRKDDIIKNGVLINLLNGRIKGRSSKDIIDEYNFNFKYNHYCILIMLINEEKKTESESAIDFIDQKVFANITCNYSKMIIETDNKKIINIINIDSSDYNQFIKNVIENTNHLHEKANSSIVLLGISNCEEELINLNKCYQQAINAIEYGSMQESESIIVYSDIDKLKYNYNYSNDIKNKLVNFVKSGDAETAEIIIEDIIKYNISELALSSEMSRCLMFDIVTDIIRIFEKPEDFCFVDTLEPIHKLMHCDSLEEIKREVIDFMKEICSYINSKDASDAKNKFIEEITEYINEHYSDKELNVDLIGYVFKKTPYYISKLFKEDNGNRLHYYINKVRIENAKALMNQSDITIGDVAEAVGYTNSHALIRAFKKYEGITPGEYRKLHS